MTRCRARIALIIIGALLLTFGSVSAQTDYRVVKVEVEGNRVASKSLILGVSAVAVGSPLSPAITTQTIRRLYGLGIFSDVYIEVEEVSGGIVVYIIVKELPKLAGLEFIGNKKVDTKDLKEELRLGVGGYISPYLMATKRHELIKLYANKGYFQAEVEPTLEYNNDSTDAILKFTINEKDKVKVEKVILDGNEQLSDNNAIKVMRNRKRGFLRSSDFAQDKYEEDLEKLIAEFHKNGYLDAYLKSDSMTIDTTRNRMTIYLDVYEGPRYYFGQTEFVNNAEMPSKYLHRKMKYEAGDVFNQEKFEESMSEIYTAYYDIGHLHIRVFDERTTREDSLIDISIDITEGLPSHINMINIVGNRKTKDHVIRREFKALPGSKFNRAILMRSVRDVMALNYFGNVNPIPVDLPNGDVDLEVHIEEKQTGQVSAGAGYNSQDKVVGNVGMGIPNFRGMGQNVAFNIEFGSNRNSFSLSFTEPWLFGRPTLFSADIYSVRRNWYDDYTETRQGFSIKFGKRLRWPDNYFRVFASYRLERDKYEDFDDTFRANNSYRDFHQFHDQYDSTFYQYTAFVDDVPTDSVLRQQGEFIYDSVFVDSVGAYEYIPREVRLVHTHSPFPGSILNYEDQWNSASRLSFTISRDSKNLPEFATSGMDFSYTIEKTGGFLGGFWDYTRHNVSFAKFFPMFWGTALAAKVEFGGIVSPAGTNDRFTLLSDRYTPGGTAYDGVVRGYDDGELTPDSVVHYIDTTYFFQDSAKIYNREYEITDPAAHSAADSLGQSETTYTTRVRGNYMLVSNIEFQIPIVKQQIYGLMFFDAGNSWLRFRDIKPFKQMYSSVGFGFRIVVPGIGTIGFDFANPLDNRDRNENGWHTHFQIGTTFR